MVSRGRVLGPLGPLAGPAFACVLSMTLLGVVLTVQAARLGQGWSSFVYAGTQTLDRTSAPSELKAFQPGLGYDGQYVYRLSLDPFTSRRTADGITLDNPPYRQQRLLLPLLAWLFARVVGGSTLVWIPVLNVLAAGLVTWTAALCLRTAGAAPASAVAVGLCAPVLIAVRRDLNEPWELALCLLGVLLAQRKRFWAAGFTFGLAVLARETALVVPAGFVLVHLWRLCRTQEDGRGRGRRRPGSWLRRGGGPLPGWSLARRELPLALPFLVYAAVHVWLTLRWPQGWGALGSGQLGVPLLGVLRSLGSLDVSGGSASRTLEVLWLVERILLAMTLAAVALTLRRSTVSSELKAVWCLAALLGVSVTTWAWAAQATRAACEAIALGILLLACAPGRRRWLLLAPIALASLTFFTE